MPTRITHNAAEVLNATVSADGRTVAYFRLGTGGAGESGLFDLWLYDRQTGQHRQVTHASDAGNPYTEGTLGNVALSADGRFVAFVSDVPTTTADDNDEYGQDVYLFDAVTGTTTRLGAKGELDGVVAPDARLIEVAISGDGNTIAFLAIHDSAGSTGVFVHNRATGVTTLASRADFLPWMQIELSGDGTQLFMRHVGAHDLFVRDLVTGAITEVAVNLRDDGAEGEAREGRVYSVSDDGGRIAYVTELDGVSRIAVYDRASGETTIVGAVRDPAWQWALNPDISGDGRFIVYASNNADLSGRPSRSSLDVYVHDMTTGETRLVTVNEVSGTAPTPGSYFASISGDGRTITVETTEAYGDDGDENVDLYVFDNPLNNPDAPRVVNDRYTVGEDADVVLDVTANDAAANGGVLTVISLGGAAATANRVTLKDGVVSYEGGQSMNGLSDGESATDSFTYTVRDSAGRTATATATVTVVGHDDPLVVRDDEMSVSEDGGIILSTATLLANDYDPDTHDTKTIVRVGQPAKGSTTFDPATGAITFSAMNGAFDTLAAGATTTTSFTYTVRDKAGHDTDGTVVVTVTGRNDAPVARADSATAAQGTAGINLWSTLLANDSDVDSGDTLTIVSVDTAGTRGTVTFDAATRTLRYTAGDFGLGDGQSATDSFAYTVRDAAGATSTARATMTVSGSGVAWVYGTPGFDVLTGTAGNDRIDGLGGSDRIDGGAGDDELVGGGYDDTLIGGAGRDILRGGDDDDTLYGDKDDVLIDGGADTDTAILDFSQATFSLELSVSRLIETGSAMVGGVELRSIEQVRITAGEGNDVLAGGRLNDTLDGGDGNDTLYGGTGYTILKGGRGDDSFRLSAAGEIWGGDGFDRALIDLRTATTDLTFAVPMANPGLVQTVGGMTIAGIEQVSLYAGSGNDRLTGGAGDDYLSGAGGADILTGGAGRDTLLGGGGRDELIGGSGDELIDGGADLDVATLDFSTETQALRLSVDDMTAGPITVAGVTIAGIELVTVTGGSANDVLIGGALSDTLRGGSGDDLLIGGDGPDLLSGGAGRDQLEGGNGKDYLFGDHLDLLLNGGADEDRGTLDMRGETRNLVYRAPSAPGGDTKVGDVTLRSIEIVDLRGGSGNDDFQGYHAMDRLFGGDGNDTLTGVAGNILYGDKGDDTLKVASGGTMVGGDGVDLGIIDLSTTTGGVDFQLHYYGIEQTVGGVTINEIERLDFRAGSGADTIWGGRYDDRFDGGDGNDTLIGLEGDDVLLGVKGDDFLLGGEGRDTLIGGEGADVLSGNAGDLLLSGGADLDTLVMDWRSITHDISFDTARIAGSGIDTYEGTTIASVEMVQIRAGSGNDQLFGHVLDDRLWGGAGNDLLVGGGGFDRLYGQDGDDTLKLTGAGIADGGTGVDVAALNMRGLSSGLQFALSDTLLAPVVTAGLTLIGLERVELEGTEFRDVVTGGALNDMLSGNGGNDVLTGEGGDDLLFGGDGDDVLTGGAGADTLQGGDGKDVLNAGFGDTLVDGGAGTDRVTIDWSDRSDLVQFRGKDMATTTGINLFGTVFRNIESMTVRGGAADDNIADNVGDDVLDGGAGNDSLASTYGGYDTLIGGDGNDLLFVHGGPASIDGGDGIDYVSLLLTNFELGGFIFDIAETQGTVFTMHGYAFKDIEQMTFEGTRFDDTVTGGAYRDILLGAGGHDILKGGGGDDLLRGGEGNDILIGGAGIDALVGENGDDRLEMDVDDVFIDGGAGFDTLVVDLRASTANLSLDVADTDAGSVRIGKADVRSIEALDIIAGSGNDVITGGIGRDLITGGGGNDILDGRRGNDWISGGAGDDVIITSGRGVLGGGSGTDHLMLHWGHETRAIAIDLAQTGEHSSLRVLDSEIGEFEQIDLVAGSGDDRLFGGALSDVFLGGAGVDRARGNGGDDRLYGEAGNDLLAGGEGADQLSGGDGDDILWAHADGAGERVLTASADMLDGGAGADQLNWSRGSVLTGGGGTDMFRPMFATDTGAIITDFAAGDGGDLLDLSTLLADLTGFAADSDPFATGFLRLHQVGGDTLVEIDRDGGGNGWTTLVTLKGVQAYALTAVNFSEAARPTGFTIDANGALPRYLGGAGNDVAIGSTAGDLFDLSQGGEDRASGGDGSDGFFLGGALSVGDIIDGGAGLDDQVGLQGNYAAGYTFGAGNLIGIETLTLLGGDDRRFGGDGRHNGYVLTTIDANVAAGTRLTVNANGLAADEALRFDGSVERDGNFLFYGGAGTEVLTGGAGSDGFFFAGGRFGSADRVDGGAGQDDQFGLQGDYWGAGKLVFGAGQLAGIETIVLLSGADTRFGSAGTGFRYDLTLHDANAAGTLKVNANSLQSGEVLRLDGSAESDTRLTVYGGRGDDEIRGGALGDVIYGGEGADRLTGGAGADTFLYTAAAQSTGRTHDVIADFDFAVDRLDVVGTTADYHRDADVRTALTLDGIDAQLTAALANVLGAHGVSLVTGAAGSALADHVFAVVDQDGVAGYTAGADLVIDLGTALHQPAAGVGFLI